MSRATPRCSVLEAELRPSHRPAVDVQAQCDGGAGLSFGGDSFGEEVR